MAGRLTATQHLRNALTHMVKARNAEQDGGYREDIQMMIDDLITELRSRRGAERRASKS